MIKVIFIFFLLIINAVWAVDNPDIAVLTELEKVTQKGDKDRQFFLGLLYADKGYYNKALQWLIASAKQGYLPAQLNLASWYELGHHDIPKNKDNALFWYKQAAELDNQAAQIIVAKTLFEQKQYKEASTWYLKLMDKGDMNAYYMLAYLFANNKGVETDKNRAFALLKQSANQDYALSQYMLAHFYQQGISTPIDEILYLIWLKKAANNGLAKAQYDLATHYYFSDNQKNKQYATYWLNQAFNQHLPEAIIVVKALKL